jgi:hypothetical protein
MDNQGLKSRQAAVEFRASEVIDAWDRFKENNKITELGSGAFLMEQRVDLLRKIIE